MTLITITFRGEERDVEYKSYGYESDTNAHPIDWCFAGLTPEQHDALNAYGSIEKLVEAWPEIAEIALPFCRGDRPPTLPAIPFKELNRMLDLTPAKRAPNKSDKKE